MPRGLRGPCSPWVHADLALLPQWVGQLEADSGLPCGLLCAQGSWCPSHQRERGAYPRFAAGNASIAPNWKPKIPGIGADFCWRAAVRQDGQSDNRRS